MRKVGDYSWHQVSMWEFTPDNCIEKFIPLQSVTCHFYLRRITEIISDSSWKTEIVTDISEVPLDILNWRNDTFNIKSA